MNTQANINVTGSPARIPIRLTAVMAIAPAQAVAEEVIKLRVESVKMTALHSVSREAA